MIARTLALATVAALLVLAAPRPQAQAQAAPGGEAVEPADASLLFTGTWIAAVTPAQAEPPPFHELITFQADGTLVETENDLTAPPFFTTIGQGAWRRSPSGGLVITYTEVHLIYDPATTAFMGTLKVQGRIVLGRDGNTFSGQAKAAAFDPDGNLLFQGNGPITGTRVKNDPF
jgi:hypothetical protein